MSLHLLQPDLMRCRLLYEITYPKNSYSKIQETVFTQTADPLMHQVVIESCRAGVTPPINKLVQENNTVEGPFCVPYRTYTLLTCLHVVAQSQFVFQYFTILSKTDICSRLLFVVNVKHTVFKLKVTSLKLQGLPVYLTNSKYKLLGYARLFLKKYFQDISFNAKR